MLSRIEPLLNRVEKPGRYVGGEINSACKDWGVAQARIALAFPDIYDLGMSYHGFRILYEHINKRSGFLADRVYTPWPDMEQELRSADVPLYALDQMRPLRDYDLIGFTLQYEMNCTNLLTMLDLAGIPLLTEERGEDEPMVIAGGEGAVAPEPLSPFVDAFVPGDGEEVVIEILEACAEWKREGADRAERLRRLDGIDGVYTPALFCVEYNEDGSLKSFQRKTASDNEADGAPIPKRHYDLRQDSGPLRPVIPIVEAVHDRFVIEIKRGCTRGCRFCAAGMITRPIRERTPEQILDIVRQGVDNTGYRDISLLSLSSADYTCLLPSVQLLNANLAQDMVTISLPSLRINAFDVRLAAEISKVRKTGFTIAPEAGTERLRKVINKVVSQDEVFRIVEQVTKLGWRTLKFYFMIGLPTEDYSDMDGVIEMIDGAWRIGRQTHGNRLKINVSLSPFVPKPHTPFQWEPQLDQDELRKRYEYVARHLGKLRGVSLKRHDPRRSMVESVLARGDRRVGLAILEAWKRGCRFDGWDQWYLHHEWLNAFATVGIDPSFYAHRMRAKDELLPWDHIDMFLGKKFLWKERRLAYKMRDTFDCSYEACVGCDACDPDEGVDHQLVRDTRRKKKGGKKIRIPLNDPEFMEPGRSWLDDNAPTTDLPEEFLFYTDSAEDNADFHIERKTRLGEANVQSEAVQRVRMTYSKKGRQRFVSHLDMVRFLQLTVQRLRLPVKWSEGFHPIPVMQFSPPLSLGFASDGEVVDLFFHTNVDPVETINAMNSVAPEGVRFHSACNVNLRAPSIESCIAGAEYIVELSAEQACSIHKVAERFNAETAYIVNVQRKRGPKPLDLKDVLLDFQLNGKLLSMHVVSGNGSLINPRNLLQAMCPELDLTTIRLTRRSLNLQSS